MKIRHSLALVGLATVALVAAACSTSDTAVTEPEIGAASFARQINRCDKYSLVDGSYTHEGARADAKLNGGVVASISSVEEQACVQALDGSGEFYWLNASDAAKEGEWRWLNARKNGLFWIGDQTGKSVGYSNWDFGGEPAGGTGENCAAIDDYNINPNPWDGKWRDFDCEIGFGYVLRMP